MLTKGVIFLSRPLRHRLVPPPVSKNCDCTQHPQSYLGSDAHLLWGGDFRRPRGDNSYPTQRCGGTLWFGHIRKCSKCVPELLWHKENCCENCGRVFCISRVPMSSWAAACASPPSLAPRAWPGSPFAKETGTPVNCWPLSSSYAEKRFEKGKHFVPIWFHWFNFINCITFSFYSLQFIISQDLRSVYSFLYFSRYILLVSAFS